MLRIYALKQVIFPIILTKITEYTTPIVYQHRGLKKMIGACGLRSVDMLLWMLYQMAENIDLVAPLRLL